MKVSNSKSLNFIPSPHSKGREGAYEVKKLAARDSHLLLNNFFIKSFGVVVLVVLVVLTVVFRTGRSSGKPLLLPVLKDHQNHHQDHPTTRTTKD